MKNTIVHKMVLATLVAIPALAGAQEQTPTSETPLELAIEYHKFFLGEPGEGAGRCR